MTKIKIIPIRENPAFIVVTEFKKGLQYHYHLNDFMRNNPHDLGAWRIKYKKP